jgi:hypothetical protein
MSDRLTDAFPLPPKEKLNVHQSTKKEKWFVKLDMFFDMH